MTYTIKQLLKRHDDWDTERAKLHERDGDGENPVSSSEWQNSDDEGSSLATLLADALRQPITVWTCTVKTPDSPGIVTWVRTTEEECWESLRENYDPEGEADDEPPVAIVGHLEDDGYVINIDVQEVARP